jgi:hypothetical protein
MYLYLMQVAFAGIFKCIIYVHRPDCEDTIIRLEDVENEMEPIHVVYYVTRQHYSSTMRAEEEGHNEAGPDDVMEELNEVWCLD